MYNAESTDVLYTVSEVAELIKTNTNYVYELINNGLLPALKLGSMKVSRAALLEFIEKYQGYDLTNPQEVKEITFKNE
ncbi:excisionase [Tepidibacillus decaturensis]|uniref:Excisionase n=1 Tax=Tepidibacillus decaturensis TaxID=1413211 RepID=A0A135L7G3_9BACI|nr:excisionase [Tepidibacillus decaturensis]